MLLCSYVLDSSLTNHLLTVSSVNFELCFFFFFNDTATTEIYTLSLHDALPISEMRFPFFGSAFTPSLNNTASARFNVDRKSTRLNSSHVSISYAVFCLKKKKKRKR